MYRESMDEVKMAPTMPEFEDKWEENEYCHGIIAQALNNLADRIAAIEEFLKKFPEPGPNMIQYKPEGQEKHLNIREVFDDLYDRLNTLDDRNK
jgi:hypothetical protein